MVWAIIGFLVILIILAICLWRLDDEEKGKRDQNHADAEKKGFMQIAVNYVLKTHF